MNAILEPWYQKWGRKKGKNYMDDIGIATLLVDIHIHISMVHDLFCILAITVHELEGFGCSGVRNREGIGMHLASFAGFTHWIRVCLRIKPETCHQVT